MGPSGTVRLRPIAVGTAGTGSYHELTSGWSTDSLRNPVSQFLHRRIGRSNPNGEYPGSTHPETKFAYLLDQQFAGGQPFHVNVVINHEKGSCPFNNFQHGCVPNIQAVLPPGSTMTVWYRESDGTVHKNTY